MKLKNIMMILAVCLMLLMLPALAETYNCEQQGFAFEYDTEHTAQWADGNGVVIYTQKKESIPYAIVWSKCETGASRADVEEAIAEMASEISAHYGDSLISMDAAYTHYVDGEAIQGLRCNYDLNGLSIEMIVLFQIKDDSERQFTAKYLQGDGGATIRAMEDAIRSFRYTSEATQPAPVEDSYSIAPAKPILAPITSFDGGYFTIDLPQGWMIQTMGAFSYFALRAWDPENPDFEIFFYGTLSPFNKSEEAKAWNGRYAYTGDIYYTMFADAPVIDPYHVEQLFCVWGEFEEYYERHKDSIFFIPGLSFPSLKNFAVLEKIPMRGLFSGYATDEAVVRGVFSSERDTMCFAKCAASLVSGNASYAEGIDLSQEGALNVNGVLAPREHFYEVEDALSYCLSTLRFSEDYIRQGMELTRQQGQAAMASNAELQAVFDSCNEAWENRQRSYDIADQAYSDATLGYERLYDPDTGEVYRAELGFYDSYNTKRDMLEKGNLQLVDSGSSDYYLRPVDYYIG